MQHGINWTEKDMYIILLISTLKIAFDVVVLYCVCGGSELFHFKSKNVFCNQANVLARLDLDDRCCSIYFLQPFKLISTNSKLITTLYFVRKSISSLLHRAPPVYSVTDRVMTLLK